MGMQTKALRFAQIAAGATVLAMVFALPASARVDYHHHKYGHRTAFGHHRSSGRVLTVRRQVPRSPVFVAPAPTPDPYTGPAAIVTAPAAIGATVVSVPFRAANVIFPAKGDPSANPLVLIGAPVHAVGQVVRLPFYAVGTAFGASPGIDY
jgi:hypothetical protein